MKSNILSRQVSLLPPLLVFININKNILLVILCIIFSSNLWAADKESEKKVDNTSLPIDLVADSGSYDQQAGVAVYHGNVRVTQGVATIHADKLTVYLKNNTAERIVAEGKPAKFDYKGEAQPIYGESNKVEYTVLSKTVALTGNAIIKQASDVIKGTTLTYDLLKEVIKGSRVQMSFQPTK